MFVDKYSYPKMSKIIAVVFFSIVFFFIGCVGNQHQKDRKDETNNLEEIANPVLLRAIDAFIDGRQTDDSLKIILIDISDSLLYICPSVYYNYRESSGYSFYKERLVGFYLKNISESLNFIDAIKLEKGVAKGYLDRYPKSDPAFDSLEYKYDYRVQTYQIYSKDSLKLIFWGYY